jgi:hypothetical protein
MTAILRMDSGPAQEARPGMTPRGRHAFATLVPRMLRSAKRCAAEPGPMTRRGKGGSRLCGEREECCTASGIHVMQAVGRL